MFHNMVLDTLSAPPLVRGFECKNCHQSTISTRHDNNPSIHHLPLTFDRKMRFAAGEWSSTRAKACARVEVHAFSVKSSLTADYLHLNYEGENYFAQYDQTEMSNGKSMSLIWDRDMFKFKQFYNLALSNPYLLFLFLKRD